MPIHAFYRNPATYSGGDLYRIATDRNGRHAIREGPRLVDHGAHEPPFRVIGFPRKISNGSHARRLMDPSSSRTIDAAEIPYANSPRLSRLGASLVFKLW